MNLASASRRLLTLPRGQADGQLVIARSVSDEAIHSTASGYLDCVASLAMTGSYAPAGRCARRNERIWRTASGTRSFGSFHGNMLTSAFGASIALSIATA